MQWGTEQPHTLVESTLGVWTISGGRGGAGGGAGTAGGAVQQKQQMETRVSPACTREDCPSTLP